MTSKNWLRKSATACGIISLLAVRGWGQSGGTAAAPAKAPALAVLDAADQEQWKTWTAGLGWQIVTPAFPAGTPEHPSIDQRVQAMAAAVMAAIQAGSADPAHIYLAGRGDEAAAVFYTISRVPDLWAAGLALGGSPQPAIDSGRIFAINFTHAPVLWISPNAADEALAARLKSDGLNLEWRSATGLANSAIFEWLTQHERPAFPSEIDCETNSPNFAHCYWIAMDQFDVGERNDVLPATFLRPSNPATLDLGIFSYSREDPGPGVALNLPEHYNGPLKKGDRLLEIEGKPVANAQAFAGMMAKATTEKRVSVMVQRGKERVRIESRIIVPHIEIPVTARVQARYEAADNDILIVSRTVKEMRVTIPPQWALGARLYWNGLALENIATPGCLKLTIDKELLHADKCQ